MLVESLYRLNKENLKMNTFKAISSSDLKITGNKCHFTFGDVKGSVRFSREVKEYFLELYIQGDVISKETTNFSKIKPLLSKVNKILAA